MWAKERWDIIDRWGNLYRLPRNKQSGELLQEGEYPNGDPAVIDFEKFQAEYDREFKRISRDGCRLRAPDVPIFMPNTYPPPRYGRKARGGPGSRF